MYRQYRHRDASFSFIIALAYSTLIRLRICVFNRALTRILKIGVKMAPSRNSWSFSIHLYWDFPKSWSQIQKVGVNYSKFGVNETSENFTQLKWLQKQLKFTGSRNKKQLKSLIRNRRKSRAYRVLSLLGSR